MKAGLNSSIILLLYKPLVTGLRKAGLITPSPASAVQGGKKPFVLIFAGLLLVSCVLVVLVLQGII